MAAGRFVISAIIVSVFFAGAAVQAQPPQDVLGDDTQHMIYEVYAGGINAVRADLKVTYDENEDYYMRLNARTQGFLGKLAPWSGVFETKGWSLSPIDKPEEHQSISIWRDEKETKTYSYSKNGHFEGLSIIEEGVDKSPAALDEALVDGTTDALTAALQVMKKVSGGDKCEGSEEVFDGKRRYELVFRHEAEENLSSSRYNVYDGVSARCAVEVVPLAGAWHKKPRGWFSIQEQGREKGSLPTIWMASLEEGGPAVPVKVRVKTNYGTLFVHLVEYRNGKAVINADNL